MPDFVKITIDGTEIKVQAGTTVAAAILIGRAAFRRSVKGDLRGPVCGMGICFECRATVDGQAQQRTCQLYCADGMVVDTDE
jgi:D-hydroxyproline dehydrogenase subunit gamma